MRLNSIVYNVVIRVSTVAASAVLMLSGALAAAENSQVSFANGLTAVVYSPDDVMQMTSRDYDGSLVLALPGGRQYRLIESTDNPQIVNRGDGSFHPFSEELVKQALSSMDLGGRALRLTVNVYILPLPRDGCLSSSTVGADIMLSPGVYDVCAYACASIVSHEVGHAFQGAYLSVGDGEEWSQYLKLRGIADDPRFVESAAHANRPTEIFAEDFRFLFGGEEARLAGTIENSSLPLPDDVPGLREFIAALVSSEPASAVASIAPSILVSNYPNPFNPVTTIRAFFADVATEAGTDVNVYRADGSLVKRLFSGMTSGGELAIRWDGTDERGGSVSSGVYLYVVRRGNERATGKMLLVR